MVGAVNLRLGKYHRSSLTMPSSDTKYRVSVQTSVQYITDIYIARVGTSVLAKCSSLALARELHVKALSRNLLRKAGLDPEVERQMVTTLLF